MFTCDGDNERTVMTLRVEVWPRLLNLEAYPLGVCFKILTVLCNAIAQATQVPLGSIRLTGFVLVLAGVCRMAPKSGKGLHCAFRFSFSDAGGRSRPHLPFT